MLKTYASLAESVSKGGSGFQSVLVRFELRSAMSEAYTRPERKNQHYAQRLIFLFQ